MSLFTGFARMRAISYVLSPDLLLEFLDDFGYTQLEVMVGENLTESYKRGLEQKGIAVAARLAQLVEEGRLRVLVPDRTIHTKLYLLEGSGHTRVIQTSANLTTTAHEASRQINYAWYVDLPSSDLLLEHLTKDYESHAARCTVFMEDLTKLFRDRPDTPREQLIEVWLKGAAADEEEVEVRRVFREISANLVVPSGTADQTMIAVRLPESPAARRHVERLLAPLEPVVAPNHFHVNGSKFIRYVHEAYGVPFLGVDLDHSQVVLGIEGSLATLNEQPSDPMSVDAALAHLEAYLNTADAGQSSDPRFAKMSMFEALLYIFAAPFFNEYMKRKRERFGIIDTRGPRSLYIYGASQNGKSTFLLFALKLMTGRNIQPLPRRDFTKTRIANAAMVGTAFPLVFDDVSLAQNPGIEEVYKSYWERWWSEEHIAPQIVMTSNTPRLREWAKSRTKRVDFDVHFAPTERDKERLNQLFQTDSLIYKWFAHAYLEVLETRGPPSDDELHLARAAIMRLYEFAHRLTPDFLPREPLERIYDPGIRDWRDLLFGLGKATTEVDRGRMLIRFAPDIQHWEINDYQSYLPQTLKCQRRGNTLIIENPSDFEKWLGPPPQRRGWIGRLLGR
ncbi:MAG TPA: hypothetical protein G4O03_04270 [Dehalococcoidia bacterium]|nr:hypothetical protein [Dehalococcoidia bacterium]